MRLKLCLFFIALSCYCQAQHSFSGYINQEEWQNSVYLSVVEDYRKISGVYSEQIIARVEPDSLGYFEFNGNMLENEHRIYRIHVDNCNTTQQDINHFNGHCEDSREVLFLAKNTDTIQLPFSFEKQVFCDIKSNNPKASAFVKIDSLKGEMRFAYSEFRSEANRKLNNKKWFKILQDFGRSLNEPIAELYIYNYLSDRSNDFHDYYIEDLQQNSYYNDLKTRLEETYPNASYTKQYINELAADQYLLTASSGDRMNWNILLYILLGISSILNIYLLYKNYSKKKHSKNILKSSLSKQEQVVLDHLLQDKTNKDIAESLFLSVSTVKTHTNNIYKKLNVKSRDEAKSLFVK